MARKKAISPEQFVRYWQQADNLDELLKKSGMTARSARARASRFRKQGVPLKKLGVGRPATDWASLKQLAESLTPAKKASARKPTAKRARRPRKARKSKA